MKMRCSLPGGICSNFFWRCHNRFWRLHCEFRILISWMVKGTSIRRWLVRKNAFSKSTDFFRNIGVDHGWPMLSSWNNKLHSTSRFKRVCFFRPRCRVSLICSPFDLDVRYRPGRLHLVPDALSRLPPKTIPGSYLETDIFKIVVHMFQRGSLQWDTLWKCR